MILKHKSHRCPSYISHSLKTHTARSIDTSCTRAKTLEHARVKQAVLLAAIAALGFLSVPCKMAFSATTTASAASLPAISFSPAKLLFASRPVGTTSAAQTISVRNLSSGILEIASLAITGTNAGDFAQTNTCGSSVAARRSCTISVTFTPTATGNLSASISITDNARGSPQTLALSGTGTASSPAATPTFSIPSGTYTSAQTVTISDSTTGATIHYTTNGTTPTTSSTQYTGAISVSSTETIEAIATASGYSTSAAATATYTIMPPAATPSFSPASGTYASAQTVTVSDTTAGSAIYYTTNGTTPTTASTQYSGPVTVSSTETIQAIATASGYSTSAVATATYTIMPPAATPSFSLATGTYTSAQTVTISDATAGATIYYTTNGTTPTTASTQYISAITVTSTETIEAIATASGCSTSSVATATYTVSVPVASVSPVSYAFPSQGIDTTSAAQTFTLSNTGSAPLTITQLAITGTNGGDFNEVADTCASSVAAGGSCTIGVTFTPSLAGNETASVTVTDNASSSPQTVSLSGTGAHDVILSWSASGTSGVSGYYIYRGTTSGGESSSPLNPTPINSTTYTDTNVMAGSTYYYVVTAVGSDGVQSPPSSETEATAM